MTNRNVIMISIAIRSIIIVKRSTLSFRKHQVFPIFCLTLVIDQEEYRANCPYNSRHRGSGAPRAS